MDPAAPSSKIALPARATLKAVPANPRTALSSPAPIEKGNSRFRPLSTPACTINEYDWISKTDCHNPISAGPIQRRMTILTSMSATLSATEAVLKCNSVRCPRTRSNAAAQSPARVAVVSREGVSTVVNSSGLLNDDVLAGRTHRLTTCTTCSHCESERPTEHGRLNAS